MGNWPPERGAHLRGLGVRKGLGALTDTFPSPPTPEVLASDGDWDSGVSLQDAEGCRWVGPKGFTWG